MISKMLLLVSLVCVAVGSTQARSLLGLCDPSQIPNMVLGFFCPPGCQQLCGAKFILLQEECLVENALEPPLIQELNCGTTGVAAPSPTPTPTPAPTPPPGTIADAYQQSSAGPNSANYASGVTFTIVDGPEDVAVGTAEGTAFDGIATAFTEAEAFAAQGGVSTLSRAVALSNDRADAFATANSLADLGSAFSEADATSSMNKAELIDAIAKDAGAVSSANAVGAIDARAISRAVSDSRATAESDDEAKATADANAISGTGEASAGTIALAEANDEAIAEADSVAVSLLGGNADSVALATTQADNAISRADASSTAFDGGAASNIAQSTAVGTAIDEAVQGYDNVPFGRCSTKFENRCLGLGYRGEGERFPIGK